MRSERRYTTEPLPCTENLERFAPPYTPEVFTNEEAYFLAPFVTNLDKPVYIVQHLPEEVIGAVSAKESRTVGSLRRVLFDEYIKPIIHPEKTKTWETATEKERNKALETRDKFKALVDFLNTHGGIEYVVNIQRGRRFFDVWLVEYGDESIAELAGIHLFLEGISNIVAKEIEDKRIGISPIEKSTRYVSFADKRLDGKYRYVIPGEIKGTPLEEEYKRVMDLVFATYAELLDPYLDYIKDLYPKGDDESDSSFIKSRRSKLHDDLRDLLPFATQTDVGLYGNCRAFEDLVNRLIDHPLGELRYWGQETLKELDLVVPSLVRRAKTEKGAAIQIYRSNLKALRDEMAKEELSGKAEWHDRRWARLISFTLNADIEILTSFLFSGEELSYPDIRERVAGMGYKKRSELLGKIFAERAFGKEAGAKREEDRFKKVARAFENAHYLLALWARGGDYRDLQRHRQATQERQRFTTRWGYDLEREVLGSPFITKIEMALEEAASLYDKLAVISSDVAQYAVPFAYLQHWYMNLTAREIYWMGELRTGPQARPHYKEVVLQIVDAVSEVSPSVFQGIMVDRNDYRLARRESEKKIERKKQTLP